MPVAKAKPTTQQQRKTKISDLEERIDALHQQVKHQEEKIQLMTDMMQLMNQLLLKQNPQMNPQQITPVHSVVADDSLSDSGSDSQSHSGMDHPLSGTITPHQKNPSDLQTFLNTIASRSHYSEPIAKPSIVPIPRKCNSPHLMMRRVF
jgi:uncharacterized coiled-coil protein SlyX